MFHGNQVTPVIPEAERHVAEEAKDVMGKTTQPVDTTDCAMKKDATSDTSMVSYAKHLYRPLRLCINIYLRLSDVLIDVYFFDAVYA